MIRETDRSGLVVAIAVLALAALVFAVADRREPNRPPVDLHYFHDRLGQTSGELNPADAAVQVKGIAAARHIPVQEVRRLLDNHVEGRDLPIGRQRVRVRDLNQALDERWPMK